MAYYLNPANLSTAFTVPCSVCDEHLKFSSEIQLKVLLCFIRNMNNGVETSFIAELLGIPESEVQDALDYWTQLEILLSDKKTVETPKKQTEAVVRGEKPTRADVARRGAEDKKIAFLLRETQLKFGRMLKSNESSTLVWLYDDLGMEVSVILMIIQHAVNENRKNIGYIEKTAVDWNNRGITTVAAAENELIESARRKTAWSLVQAVFCMERRMPSTKESHYADCWVNEWGFSEEMLKAAYDACVDVKSKLSIPYINKILEDWHKAKAQTVADIEKLKENKTKKQGKKTSGATYDIDLFEKMLNSED